MAESRSNTVLSFSVVFGRFTTIAILTGIPAAFFGLDFYIQDDKDIMLRIADREYNGAMDAIYVYLDCVPDARAAWASMKTLVDDFIEAIGRRNYHEMGFKDNPTKSMIHQGVITLEKEDSFLPVLSSHDANRLSGFKSWASFESRVHKQHGAARFTEPSTKQLIECSKEIEGLSKALELEEFTLTECKTTKVNMFFPLYRATPDVIAACGDKAVLIEVKEVEQTEASLKQAKFQICCQMIVWSIPTGVVAFKTKGEPRGKGWTFIRYTGESMRMYKYVEDYMNSKFCVKLNKKFDTPTGSPLVPLISKDWMRIRNLAGGKGEPEKTKGRKRNNQELASVTRERERARAREEKRKMKEQNEMEPLCMDSNIGKRSPQAIGYDND